METEQERTRRIVRDWLAGLPALTGKSLTRIAAEIGVATTTLTKPVNRPDHPHVTSFSTIAKIARHYGISPPVGIEAGGIRLAGRGLAEPEAEPFAYEDEDERFNAMVRDYIGDRPGIDPWRLRTRALELAGFLPGDVVVIDMNATPKDGDVVVAQVYDRDTGRAETVWRVFEDPYLRAATTERLRSIHKDAAALKGVVLVMFRPRQND